MTDVAYSVRRSERARRARIVVDPRGVEVVIPRRMGLRPVAPFVEGRRPGIDRTLRRMREAELDGPSVTLRDGGRVPYLGTVLTLRVRVDRGRARAHVARRADELRVALGPGQPLAAAVTAWYKRRAREEVGSRLDAATARAGTSYSKLSIRSQRTRWASCSSDGAMSFNWRLLLAPPEILDYVVEHEVADVAVLGHSSHSWLVPAIRCPRD